jgi:hypothetical protein
MMHGHTVFTNCGVIDSFPLHAGTDDDLAPSQNRGPRGRSFSGNGRASAGSFPYTRPHNDLESEVHLVEQQAYTGVLRAFKVQSDALSWVNNSKMKLVPSFSNHCLSFCFMLELNYYACAQEKESLISELRKELRVSDEEHRELLNKVNDDGAIRRMRSLLT